MWGEACTKVVFCIQFFFFPVEEKHKVQKNRIAAFYSAVCMISAFRNLAKKKKKDNNKALISNLQLKKSLKSVWAKRRTSRRFIVSCSVGSRAHGAKLQPPFYPIRCVTAKGVCWLSSRRWPWRLRSAVSHETAAAAQRRLYSSPKNDNA